MSKSLDNLLIAFAGESQANRKYLAFAKKADDEGFHQIAKLFRAAAAAETVHAMNHFRAMDGAKSTMENLGVAVAAEHYEVVTMYPPMLAGAEAESDKRASRSFKYALEVEKIHEALYSEAHEILSTGKDTPETDYYVCPVCGNTHKGPLDGFCPICGTPGERFERIA